MTAARKLPQYECRKTVGAFKISAIVHHDDGSAVLHGDTAGDNRRVEPVHVSAHFLGRNTPREGGYFVQYEDGYTSYSPAHAFEKGYVPIDDQGFPLASPKSRYPYPADKAEG